MSRLPALFNSNLNWLSTKSFIKLNSSESSCSCLILAAVISKPVVDDVSVCFSIIVSIQYDITVSREENAMFIFRNAYKIKHLHSEDFLDTTSIVHHVGGGCYSSIFMKCLGIKFGLNSFCNSSA